MEKMLPLAEIFPMYHELRIRPRAQFVQVHALALALVGDALGIEAIQEPVPGVENRQGETKQRGDGNQLGQKLPVASTPHNPPTPYTEMAPPGSSSSR